MATASPDTITDVKILQDMEALFDKMYQVVILDSDKTTFEEVIISCVVLFKYTPEEGMDIAQKVHTTGEAVAHLASKAEADKYVTQLAGFNVRAEAREA